MRVAWLVGLVVVAGCEVPTQDRPEQAPARPVQAAGVNCRLIAQTITSLELGNYAELEVRAPREREIEGLCVRAKLTKADAECLLAAPSIEDLGYCAKPLVVAHTVQQAVAPGDVCEAYIRALEKLTRCPKLPAETARQLRDQIPTIRKMYADYGHQQQVKDSCKMAIDATAKAMQQVGC